MGKYATLGVHCNRFGKGFTLTQVKDDSIREYNHLKNKILARMVNLAKAFLPMGLLSQLKNIKKW